MKATLIAIATDADHVQAKALVAKLMGSRRSDDRVRLAAHARLIESYGRNRWPRTMPPLLGTASRVSEVMNGKRELSMNVVRRLRG
jgi:HTH-type transcriptional regulator/antitoxin HigA